MVVEAEAGATAAQSTGKLQKAVLLTLAYSDLFDYPLEEGECLRFLIGSCASPAQLAKALADLESAGRVERDGDLLYLAGRAETIRTRRSRRIIAEKRWPAVLKFAAWLEHVPFLRMVAVCGSHAMANADADGDVDLFIIVAPKRVWLAQCAVMLAKRAGRTLGLDFCPNFILSEHALRLEQRNLYSAHEVAQAIPLWGEAGYRSFVEHNGWVRQFLPQVDFKGRRRYLRPRRIRRHARLQEKALSGALGDALDRIMYKILVRYYALRLRRRGWGRKDIELAYQPTGQTVIRGGFTGAVRQAFETRAAEVVDDGLCSDSVQSIFDGDGSVPAPPDPLYVTLYNRRYGANNEAG